VSVPKDVGVNDGDIISAQKTWGNKSASGWSAFFSMGLVKLPTVQQGRDADRQHPRSQNHLISAWSNVRQGDLHHRAKAGNTWCGWCR
jgi:hypothetical protein